METVEQLYPLAYRRDEQAIQSIRHYFYTYLERFFSLYEKNIDHETLHDFARSSVEKALERGLRFQVLDMEGYMEQASSIYFKAFIAPPGDELRLPKDLVDFFALMDILYESVPELSRIEINRQTEIWSDVLSMNIFQARMLYHSFRKLKEGMLRQVDADLTFVLLPKKKRGEYEVLHEPMDETTIIARIKEFLI